MDDLQFATIVGGEHRLAPAAIAKFVSGLRGSVLRPADIGYDDARKVWNGMVDKRPALIARCAGPDDVVACVRFARENEILVSVRGGGHNYAGKSVCDGGLVIDLSQMKAMRVDPAKRIAHAQAGLRLGEFDRETQTFGLATTLGANSDTGIAGLTLGGGYGWLAGRFGLASDNVLSMSVVTADGESIEVNSATHADLYWGMRGAGANLGIVTSFEYGLHPVGPVLGGLVIYPISWGRSALRLIDDFGASCPDEVSIVALMMTAPNGEPAVAAGVCYSGPLDRGESVLAPLTRSGPTIANLIKVQPYTSIQTMFDVAWPPGRFYYSKSSIARRLNDEMIGCLLDFSQTFPTNLSSIAMQQLHGAAGRIGTSDTAFPHRFDHFSVYVHPATDVSGRDTKDRRLGTREVAGTPALYGSGSVRQRY